MTAGGKTPPIVIASYNVLADAYIRRKYFRHCDPLDLKPAVRHPKLIERVVGLGADVLCLTEVEHRMFTKLDAPMRALGYRGRWAHKGRGKPDGCALFVRTPLACLKTRIIDFDDGVPPDGPSGYVAIEALIGRGGATFTVFVTHFKWEPPEAPVGKRCGLKQADLVLDAARACDGPVVVCGDFNVQPDSEIVAAFRASGFTDAHPPSVLTSNANGRAKKIDFIMYRGLTARPLPTPRIADKTPLPSPDEPSDHLPLVAAFTPLR